MASSNATESAPLLQPAASNSNYESDYEVVEDDQIDPFHTELHFSWWQIFKIALGTVTVLPIRLFLTFILICIGFVLCPMLAVGMTYGPSGATQPFLGWRLYVLKLIRFLGRIWFFIMGFYYVPTRGKIAPREEAPIVIVAPHSSFVDGVALMMYPLCSIVTRNDNVEVPLLGSLLHCVQPIAVHREDPDSRTRVLEEIKRRANDDRWPRVMIFPEGTCTNRKALLPFKKGPFCTGRPVQPIIYFYPNSLDCTTWTFTNPLFLLYLLWTQFVNYCEVEFMPVYKPSEEEKANPDLYAENVRRMMARRLRIPLSPCSHRDFARRMKEMGKPRHEKGN